MQSKQINSRKHYVPQVKSMNTVSQAFRVGHNRICTPYMTICMVVSMLKISYIPRIYGMCVRSWPSLQALNTAVSQ